MDEGESEVGSLQKIDGSSIHRICSGQVVVDLRSAVKELVENSLDAGASSVLVHLDRGGFQLLQINDNGRGISPQDYKTIALKHYTSKLRNFEQLTAGISSLGFRGEALSSLCALSGTVCIETRRQEDANGVRLEYDQHGQLVQVLPASHPVGTTVEVRDLFSPAPVRLEKFKKKHKQQFQSVLSLMQEYAIANPAVTFRVTLNPFRANETIRTR